MELDLSRGFVVALAMLLSVAAKSNLLSMWAPQPIERDKSLPVPRGRRAVSGKCCK